MTIKMKGMLVTLGILAGLSASRLIIYGPQTLKEKFSYTGKSLKLLTYLRLQD
jgi:hypothetical protein